MKDFLSYTVLTIFFIAFILFIYRSKLFNDNIIKRDTLFLAFIIKILAGFLLIFIYARFYQDRGNADIFKYYDDAKVFKQISMQQPKVGLKMLFEKDGKEDSAFAKQYYNKMQHWNYTYGNHFGTHNMIKINAVLLLLSGGLYATHALFFLIISFLGLWLIYLSIKQFFIGKELFLFFLLFFFPSLLIWTSGVLKESILIAALGLFLFALFRSKKTRNRILLFLLTAVLFWLIRGFTVIFLILSIPFAFYKKKNSYVFYLLILSVYILAFILLREWIMPILAQKRISFLNVARLSDAGSLVIPPVLNPTLSSFIINIPFALKISFLYPLIWKIQGFIQLIPAFGNIFIIAFLLLSYFFRQRLNHNQKGFLFFSLAFILFNYIGIGMVCPIVGAVVRYKIFGELFLIVLPLLLIDKQSILKKLRK